MQKRYIVLLLILGNFWHILGNTCEVTETLKRPFRTAENNQAYPIKKASLIDVDRVLSSLCCIENQNECLARKIDQRADIIEKEIEFLRIELNYIFEDIVATIQECCNDIRIELNYIFEDLTKIIVEVSSQLEQCCEFLTSAIENVSFSSVVEVTITSLIDQSTETILSTVEECCLSLTDSIEESTESIFSKIDECCGFLNSVIDISTTSIIDTTVTSLIDQSTETIVSSVENCCDFLFSVIESSVGSINSSIDVGIGSIIDQSNEAIFSKIDECCSFLSEVIETSTFSVIDRTVTSLIDQSTESIFSKIDECCGFLTSVIDTSTFSVIDTTITSLIDQSTETIVSSLEECCNLLASGIENLDEKLDALTGSTLDDVVTRIEILISGLDIIISQAEGLIPVFSTLEELAEDILINISIIDFAFNKTISAVEECCMSITDTIEESTESIFSKIDECCGFLTSVIDTSTTSILETTITSLIDQSTSTISSRIETCCNTLSEQIENSTEIITNEIFESTTIIGGAVAAVSSQLEQCCDVLISGIENLDDKLDALTGSTLDDVVTRIEILISGLDIIISQAEGLIPVFSTLEELAEDILINISVIDFAFNKTISAVEECCMSITDTIEESTESIFSKIDECCDFLNSVIDTSTFSVIDTTITSLIDQSTNTLSSRFDACCQSLSDKIDTCCETLSEQISDSTDLINNNIVNATTVITTAIANATAVVTTAIANSTNTITNEIGDATNEINNNIENATELTLSQLDVCCDFLSSGIENLDDKLDALTGSTLDDVVTRLEILISGLDIIISQADGLIPVFSTLEALSEEIFENISIIDAAFDRTVSAVEECCMSLTDRIEESTDSIFSKIDECCDFLNSVIDNTTSTASVIDTTITSLIDQSTNTLSSKIDACCQTLSDKIDTCCETLSDQIDNSTNTTANNITNATNTILGGIANATTVITNAIANSTNTIVNEIDGATDEIIGAIGAAAGLTSSQLEQCCDVIISGIEDLDEKLDALTGSTLDDVVTRLEILISGLDIIISQADGLIPVFSTLEVLSEEIFENISIIDAAFDRTVSAVEECCASIMDEIGASAAFTCSCVDANFGDLTSLVENIDIQLGDRTVVNEFNAPFTVTNPGSYIISSDFNNPSPIQFTFTISGVSDVILDLNNFIIDGGGVSLGGIQISGATNVIVQNGSIINSGGPAIEIVNSMNVVIENVIVNGTATPGGATIIINNSTQTILQDVLAFNESGGPVVEIINSSNTTIQDTTGKSSTGGGFPSGIFSVASSLATRFINTIACSPFGIPSTAVGFGISASTGVGFFNTSALNCDVGFQIEDSIDVIFDHSIAQENAGNGVMFLGAGSDTFVVCFSTAIGNGDNGFYIDGFNTIFKNCVSTNNGGSGFFLDANTEKCIFEICIATDNDVGLNIDASATIVNIYDSYFKGNNTDIINPSNALFVNIDTTLEILCSKIEHCCTELASGIENIDDKLDALTGSTLDDVVTRLELLISGLDIIISQADGLIPVFSTLEVLSEEIFENISIIDAAFDKTVSAVEQCCMSINEAIDQSTNIIIGAIDESTDVIISTLDNVDCLIGTPITSVPFIITTPGLYTLCGDLTQTGVTPAITISSDDVTLDLREYTLTTTGVGSRGIEVSSGMTNITIRNGNIVPDREAIFVNLNHDVLIEDISIYNAGNTAIRVESSLGVIIDRCQAIESTGANTGTILPSAFWFGITDVTGDGRLSAVVTNCTVRSDSLNGFFIRGFTFFSDIVFTETNIRFENCTVQGVSLNGYNIHTEDDILEGSSFDFINCDASFCTNGFILERTGGTTQEVAYYFENCRALSDRILVGTNGFNFSGINEAVCRYCTAYNFDTGFNVGSSTDSVLLDNCIAELNITGFLIDGVDTLCVECKAVGNTGTGFDINGDRTVIKNSCATGNDVGIDIDINADDVKIVETCSLNNVTANIIDNGPSTTFVSIEVVQSILELVETDIVATSECILGTEITSVPFVITTPGLYSLCDDLTQTGVAPAITIASDDVTLDLRQRTLTTTGVGSRGIEISAGMINITIRNGNIVPNVEAIFVNLNQDVLIEDISIYNAGDTAIRVESSIGVIIDRCSASGSSGNATGTLFPSAFWFGITDITGDTRLNAVVTNCIVSGDSLTGIFLKGFTFFSNLQITDTSTRFENCTVHTASQGYHIHTETDILLGTSFECINCDASDCFTGFILESFGGTTQDVTYFLENCRSLRRSVVFGAEGFNFGGINNAICRYCTASGTAIGFNIGTLTDIILDNCIAESNSSTGFFIQDFSSNTLCVECKAVANIVGFSIAGDNTVLKRCSATANDTGILITGTANSTQLIETCAVNNGTTNISDNGTSTNIVNLEFVQDALVGTPITSINIVPFTITSPGLYTVANNISTLLTPGTAAITISADDVILDLGGHNINVAISGVGVVNAIEVLTGVDNFEIRNGTIAAGASTNGITISSATNCNGYIHDLLIRGTSGSVLQGIDIVSSTALTIEQCQFDLMNIGIRSTGASAKFVVNDCVVTDAIANGMEFASSTGEGFEVNRCSVYSAAGTGGFVLNTATRAMFTDCKAVDCAGAGFVITAADTFAILRNCLSLTNAGVGYSILGNGALLENCIATENGSTGFNASSTATVDVTLRGCISTGNASFGFFIASDMTTLENCLSTQNTGDGFSSLRVGVSQVDFRGCTSTNNGDDGFDMGMAGNLLKDCLASHNVGSGLDDNGFAQVILDTRSALNGAADVVGASTVITY